MKYFLLLFINLYTEKKHEEIEQKHEEIKQLEFVKLWLKNPEGEQKLFCNGKKCKFIWNFKKNYEIQLIFNEKKYLINEKEILYFYKKRKERKINIKTNFSKLIQTNILNWKELLSDIEEINEKDSITVFAKYKNKRVCIYLKKNPFEIYLIKIDNITFRQNI